jgi:hypothetical protein
MTSIRNGAAAGYVGLFPTRLKPVGAELKAELSGVVGAGAGLKGKVKGKRTHAKHKTHSKHVPHAKLPKGPPKTQQKKPSPTTVSIPRETAKRAAEAAAPAKTVWDRLTDAFENFDVRKYPMLAGLK